ncbi:MAG: YiiX/YebB-like N1pC/P60 family cysteine hydrolase [Bacteroidota bacterium]
MSYRRSILIIAITLFFSNSLVGQPLESIRLSTGDLLFEDLDCGPLCDAIEQVTQAYDGHHFSHIGLVYKRSDTIYVIEAMGSNVKAVTLDHFVKRTPHKVYVARLKKQYQSLITPAIQFALSTIGTPYDDAFLYDNGKYYCSELIYDAFMKANNNKPFFRLEPMTFKQPGTDEFYPAWIEYYSKLEINIPEGKPGINPGGISLSDKIVILNPVD